MLEHDQVEARLGVGSFAQAMVAEVAVGAKAGEAAVGTKASSKIGGATAEVAADGSGG